MVYFPESLVEWYSMWDEVKKTVIMALIFLKRSCAVESIKV